MLKRSRAYQLRYAVALTLSTVLAAIFVFGAVDSLVGGQAWWPPALVAILCLGITGIALNRLRIPYEVAVMEEGFRVRRSFSWAMYRWDDVNNFREEPNGWVHFDFIPDYEPRGWHWVTETAGGTVRADRLFPNMTTLPTEELVAVLENAQQRRQRSGTTS